MSKVLVSSPLYYSRFTIHYSLMCLNSNSRMADTLATLHMWTQVVGKVRLKQTPLVNHWWNVPLYISARGLTTTAMPYRDRRVFEIEFDFIDHRLLIECSDGASRSLVLRPQSVADFYAEVMSALKELGIEVKIWTTPVEIPDPIRFEDDTIHASYDPEYANRFWRALVKMDDVLKEFRSRFIGKVSPVHFFWGSLIWPSRGFREARAAARRRRSDHA